MTNGDIGSIEQNASIYSSLTFTAIYNGLNMLPHHDLTTKKPYAFKSRTELAIENFAGKENPTQSDMNAVLAAGQVEEGIAKMLSYLNDSSGMSRDDLEDEIHDSQKLGERMALAQDCKPHSRCHAHAIISGGHAKATTLRGIMAKFSIRIDDPDNGCWLPENTDSKKVMPPKLKNAVPHSRIHRNNYYFWLGSYINMTNTIDEKHLRFQFSMVEQALREGSFPPYVLLPASQEYQP